MANDSLYPNDLALDVSETFPQFAIHADPSLVVPRAHDGSEVFCLRAGRGLTSAGEYALGEIEESLRLPQGTFQFGGGGGDEAVMGRVLEADELS